MRVNVQILKQMYEDGRVTLDGLRKAVADKTITAEEFQTITGEPYEEA